MALGYGIPALKEKGSGESAPHVDVSTVIGEELPRLSRKVENTWHPEGFRAATEFDLNSETLLVLKPHNRNVNGDDTEPFLVIGTRRDTGREDKVYYLVQDDSGQWIEHPYNDVGRTLDRAQLVRFGREASSANNMITIPPNRQEVSLRHGAFKIGYDERGVLKVLMKDGDERPSTNGTFVQVCKKANSSEVEPKAPLVEIPYYLPERIGIGLQLPGNETFLHVSRLAASANNLPGVMIKGDGVEGHSSLKPAYFLSFEYRQAVLYQLINGQWESLDPRLVDRLVAKGTKGEKTLSIKVGRDQKFGVNDGNLGIRINSAQVSRGQGTLEIVYDNNGNYFLRWDENPQATNKAEVREVQDD